MNNNQYFAEIMIDDQELDEIMKKLDDAKQAIYDCYDRLRTFGIIVVKKENADSGN